MTTMTGQKSWTSSRYAPEDAQDRLQLLRKIWGDGEPADSAYQDWLCHGTPAGPAIAAVAREVETAQLIGEAATIPVRVTLSGKPRTAGLCLAPQTDPAYQDRDIAASLLRDACAFSGEEGVAFSYSFPDALSHWAFVHRAEFKDIGAVPLLIRPLNVERLALRTTQSPVEGKATSFARRVWGTSQTAPPREAPSGLEIAEVASFDDSFGAFWYKIRHRFPVMVVRDPAYLNWRFVDVPTREYTIFAARSEGQIRGFTVLRVAPLGRFAVGLIADLVVDVSAEGRAAGRLLIDLAYSHFEGLDLDLVASLALRHTDEFRLLRSRGFRVCPKFLQPHPFRLVVRCHDEEASRVAYQPRNWFVTMADYEAI